MQIANHIPGQGLRTERKPSNSTARKLTAQWEKAKVCRCLSKDTQTLSKHRERRSAPLVIGDIQVRCHTARMAPCKNPGSRCRRVSPWGGQWQAAPGTVWWRVELHREHAAPTVSFTHSENTKAASSPRRRLRFCSETRSERPALCKEAARPGVRSPWPAFPTRQAQRARSVGDGAHKLHC